MRTVTAKWFECAVQYDKLMENDTQKKVTERYVVDAISFTEAEIRIIKEIRAFVSGELDVKGIVPQRYSEVIFTDNEDDENFFKVKVAFITIDEKTGAEKQQNVIYLVQARTPDDAISNTKKVLDATSLTYETRSTVDTKVMDVFVHKINETPA